MSRWAIHTSPQLKSYVSGRVGLIGDAVSDFAWPPIGPFGLNL